MSHHSSHSKTTNNLKIGILGSGLMGHGIAYVSALSGMDVVMTDISQKQVDSGLARIKVILDESIKDGFITEQRMVKTLANINATDDYTLMSGCDLIIEAVNENRDLKAEVIARAEQFLNPDGIFASNTCLLYTSPSPRD